jgi:hypothetical protein
MQLQFFFSLGTWLSWLLRVIGTAEFSRNTMGISTACRSISSFPWPALIGVRWVVLMWLATQSAPSAQSSLQNFNKSRIA